MEKLKQDAYTLELGNINFFHSACSDLHLDEEDIKTLADLIDRKSMSELSSFLESLALSEEVQTFFL
ncbi:ATP phosphoribosyltransferase regulatory subunit, partial [Gordonibacter pamelaeae]|nr:ATP phosphoribosyltransferase regulatory subunit [Gordonibacter pamelaeae]